jgi:hypothetical protein
MGKPDLSSKLTNRDSGPMKGVIHCRATKPVDPAPVRDERQGARICAIEITPRRIRNATNPSV